MSPHALHADFAEVQVLKRSVKGELVVNAPTQAVIDRWLLSTKLGEWKISCRRPSTSAGRKAVLSNVPLDISDEELSECLSPQGVVSAVRMMRTVKDATTGAR